MRKYIVRWKIAKGRYCTRTHRHMPLAAQCVRDVETLFPKSRVSVKIKDVKRRRVRVRK